MFNKEIWIFGIILIFLLNTAQASDWPMFMHDAARTGSTDELVEPPLELQWQSPIGLARSSPAIYNDVLYINAFNSFSSNSGMIYALDAKNGTIKWKYGIGSISDSSPAVFNDTIYVGTNGVHAIDAATGTLKWKFPLNSVVHSSPVISNGTLYIGSYDNDLYALDAFSGTLKWNYTTGTHIFSSPAVYNGIVYFNADGIYALDAATGALIWKNTTSGNGAQTSPAVYGKMVYVSSAGVYAFDALTGSFKWRNKMIASTKSSPAISKDILFVGSDSGDGFYALEAATGTLKWKYDSSSSNSSKSYSSYSSPAVSGDHIYFSSDSYLYVLDASTGTPKGKYSLGFEQSSPSSPVISEGIVYVNSESGALYAFKPSKNPPTSRVGASGANNIASSPSQKESDASESNNTLYWIILAGIIIYIFTGIYFLKSRSSSSSAKNKALELKQSQETASRSFEEGFNLSQEASAFFAKKNFKRALESYNKALTKFESTRNSPHIDTSLSTSIKNNKASVQSNIVSCKLALGSSASEQGKTSLDKGDFNNAIKSYNNAKSYFEEALQDASVIKDEEKLTNTKYLLSQTITNIENCYINIDRRKVEELSESAESMLKEAEDYRNRKELSRARDVLKNAENNIEEAFDIATRRGFNEAQRILSTLLKNVRAEKNVVDSLFMTPIDRIKTDHHVSAVLALEPEIRAANTICELQVLRGYSVLSNNDIKFGVRLTNNTNFVITDADVILYYAKNLFSMKEPEIHHLGNIMPNGAITATYLLKPRGCIHNEHISALITYKDHTGKKQTLDMKPKEVHCVCPFLKEKPISEGEYSRLASSSEYVQEGISFKGIGVEELAIFMCETCRHMLHKVREYDIEGKKVIYLSGESIGEKAYYLLTAVIQEYKGLTQVVLRAHSDKKYGLNGFMNEMADSLRHLVGAVQNAKEIGIIENTQVINIIDSVVQRTSFQMGEGGNAKVNIKDSVVQRSNFGTNEDEQK